MQGVARMLRGIQTIQGNTRKPTALKVTEIHELTRDSLGHLYASAKARKVSPCILATGIHRHMYCNQ